MSRKTILLLRYVELETNRVRGEISDNKEDEIQKILDELGLTRDQAIEEAMKIVVKNYGSK